MTSVAQLAARVPGHSYSCSCWSSVQATCLRAHTNTTMHIFQTIYSRVVFRVCGFVDEKDQNLRLFPTLHFTSQNCLPKHPHFHEGRGVEGTVHVCSLQRCQNVHVHVLVNTNL